MLEWSSFEEEDEPEPVEKVIYRSPKDDFVAVCDGEAVFPEPPHPRMLQKVRLSDEDGDEDEDEDEMRMSMGLE